MFALFLQMGRLGRPSHARCLVVRGCIAAGLLVGSSLASAAIEFEDMTPTSGLAYSGETYGASWGDVNSDGYPDLFANHHRQMPGLFFNNTNGTFFDAGSLIATWANNPDRDMHGGSFGDFDNDGDQDFMVSTGRGSDNQFFVNENGLLVDRTTDYSLNFNNWAGRLPIWFDQNDDGKLDFSMSNFNGRSPFLNQSGGGFTAITAATGSDCTLMPYAQLLDITGDGRMDFICARQGKYPYQAYDTSSLPFTDVAANIPTVFATMDTTLADFDNNLKQDVFYARSIVRSAGVAQAGSTGIEAALVRDNKGFTFASDGVITVDISSRVVRDSGNFNNIKIGAGGFSPAASSFVLDKTDASVQGLPTYNPADAPVILIGYDTTAEEWTFVQYTGTDWSYMYVLVNSTEAVTNLQATGLSADDGPFVPVLHLQQNAGFVDNATAAGLGALMQCASAVAADFDNDMDIDLYIACRGGVENFPNRLYENNGSGGFTLVATAGGAEGPVGVAFAESVGTAESVISADYDVDGFVDLFVTNGLNLEPEGAGGPDKLFRNKGNSNHWLQLDLVGTTSTRDAIGSRVIATAGGTDQLRELNGGYHRWSQDDRRVHFGLAANTTVDITVQWASGLEEVYEGLAADSVYRVTEATGIEALDIGQPPEPTLAVTDATAREDESSMTVTVSLTPASDQLVAVDYVTASDTAIAGLDFESTSGNVEFAVGETIQQFSINLLDDDIIESDEDLIITLSNSANAPIGTASANGTIQDDEVDVCNAPTYDKATERGAYLWRNCTTGVWQARFTAGATNQVSYQGNVTADPNFDSVTSINIEGNDTLDNETDPGVIDYELNVGVAAQDGFAFSYTDGAKVCLDIEAPQGTALLVGADQVPVALPVDLDSLGACTESVCHSGM